MRIFKFAIVLVIGLILGALFGVRLNINAGV